MYHPKGYGRRRRRRLLDEQDVYDEDPFGGPSIYVDEEGVVQIDRKTDCAEVPAAGAAVCYAWNR